MPDFWRSRGPKIAIGGLALINVALVSALILREPAQTVAPAAVASPAPASATPTADPTSTPARAGSSPTTPAAPQESTSPSPSPSASAATQIPRASRLLAADSATTAWRAKIGSCGQKSTVSVSTNGGKTWRDTDPGLYSIVRLKAYGTSSVFAVGSDKNCRPSYAWITAPGAGWKREASGVSDKWFRYPNQPDTVHAPGGNRSQPCVDGIADLAGLGTYQAAALCTDGQIRTKQRGQAWRTVRHEGAAIALNADDSRFIAALRKGGCSGVVVQSFGVSGQDLRNASQHCADLPDQASTALSNQAGTTWLWSGQKTTVLTRP